MGCILFHSLFPGLFHLEDSYSIRVIFFPRLTGGAPSTLLQFAERGLDKPLVLRCVTTWSGRGAGASQGRHRGS